MPDRVVLDTGIIFAVYFKEEASSRAKKVAAENDPITVDLAFAEAGNAAWKRVVLFGEDRDASQESLSKCIDYIKSCTILRSSDLTDLAFKIAVENKTTFYDSLFLAAAEIEKVPLLTLDKKLFDKVKANKDIRLI
ncbi:MAG: type II toxin-antitoxin system VapC family toxin [Methanotrichaceae archaeon]